MLKIIALAAALAAAAAAAAHAQTPANADECLRSAFELAQKAEDKKLPADQSKKVDEMLNKMEGYCDAKKFPEAAGVAVEVRKSVDGK